MGDPDDPSPIADDAVEADLLRFPILTEITNGFMALHVDSTQPLVQGLLVAVRNLEAQVYKLRGELNLPVESFPAHDDTSEPENISE